MLSLNRDILTWKINTQPLGNCITGVNLEEVFIKRLESMKQSVQILFKSFLPSY